LSWRQYTKFGFIGIIAITALIYAGFLYLTAGFDDGNAEKAKKIIMYVVIGIIFILEGVRIVYAGWMWIKKAIPVIG
jgi:hypothetical protein